MDQITKHVTLLEAKDFLEKYYGSSIKSLLHIQEGKHSDAFSYLNDDQGYVVRFNITDEGFLKDKYAYENFSGPDILIPKIIKIGTYGSNLFFCISEKVRGETAKEQYAKKDFGSLYIQFKTIEAIKMVCIDSNGVGFGKWSVGKPVERSFGEYFTDICNGDISDWTVFESISYFDKEFVQYLLTQIQKYSQCSNKERVLVHGDFGGSNLLIREGKVSGVIDWANSFYGDRFWDVGRVVLFCPNRKVTTEAALDFYKDNVNYKERIAWGVYCVMLKNYGIALQSGQEASCLSSATRIKDIEGVLGL